MRNVLRLLSVMITSDLLVVMNCCLCCCTVSENKVLTHPSSVDSITTSAGTEDHVSMGGYAARKALTVVEHVENGKIYHSVTYSPNLTPAH